jgi:hypothetical protein
MLACHVSGRQNHAGVVLAIETLLLVLLHRSSGILRKWVQRGLTHLVWTPPGLWELRQLCRLPPTANSLSTTHSKHIGHDSETKSFCSVRTSATAVCVVFTEIGVRAILNLSFFFFL